MYKIQLHSRNIVSVGQHVYIINKWHTHNTKESMFYIQNLQYVASGCMNMHFFRTIEGKKLSRLKTKYFLLKKCMSTLLGHSATLTKRNLKKSDFNIVFFNFEL